MRKAYLFCGIFLEWKTGQALLRGKETRERAGACAPLRPGCADLKVGAYVGALTPAPLPCAREGCVQVGGERASARSAACIAWGLRMELRTAL
jgi:hypothetical protein